MSIRDEVQAILGEEHPYGPAQTTGDVRRAAQQAAHQDDDANVGAPAGETGGAFSIACPDCGQLAMVAEHGPCACQQIEADE